MLYRASYTLHGRPESHLGSHAQMRALADYIRRTFRKSVLVERVAA